MSAAGQRILRSTRQALAFARGETTEGIIVHALQQVDVKDIRQKTDLSQEAFAREFGFTATAARDW